MKSFATTARVTLATAATLTALIGYASAADLRRAPVPYQPPPPPRVFNWSGCYIGGYVGGAFNERDAVFTDRGNSTFRAFSGGIVGGRAENSHSWNIGQDSSFIRGSTWGCNWQPVGSPFVLGIEGEAGYMKLEGSAFDPLLNPNLSIAAVGGTPDVLGRAKIGDWYGMITGRIGICVGNHPALCQRWRRFRSGSGVGPRSVCGDRQRLRQLADLDLSIRRPSQLRRLVAGLEWAFAPQLECQSRVHVHWPRTSPREHDVWLREPGFRGYGIGRAVLL